MVSVESIPLVQEIGKVGKALLEDASLKERAFYRYLTGDPLSEVRSEGLSDIERACALAFTSADADHPDIKSIRGSEVAGMHYSKNLVDLSAVAMLDREAEEETLKEYCRGACYRDCYILERLFGLECTRVGQELDRVDRLVKRVLIDGELGEWRMLIRGALQDASSLSDVFVIECAYEEVLDLDPKGQLIQDLKGLYLQTERLRGALEGLFLVSPILLLILFIITNDRGWRLYVFLKSNPDLARVITIGTGGIFLLEGICAFVFGIRFGVVAAGMKLRDWYLKGIYWAVGVDIQAVERAGDRYINGVDQLWKAHEAIEEDSTR